MANVKLSQIASGGLINVSTDTAVTVRSGTTDVLVTFAASAQTDTTTTSNITDSTNKRFVTDAELVVLGNTSGTNSGDVTLGTADGLSLSGQVLSLGLASTSATGALSSTDWNTFNGKQASGNYITALTGDGTASGPGSVSFTLATVNSNTGSFGSSTSIPNFTTNAKGLLTAAGSNVVIAPAGTLSGTTLNSTVTASSLTGLGAQSQALNMNNHLIDNVTDPASPQDAATKNYVDLAVASLAAKNDCQAATTTALAAATYNNGSSGVGATLTLTVAAVLVLDGYTPALNDRLLIKNQASAFQNGIYYLSTVGVLGVTQAVLTRTLDFDQPGDGINGALVYVLNGTANGNTLWSCTTSGTITFGTTNINWSQFTGTTYTADGTTLQLSGTTFSLKQATPATGGTGLNTLTAHAVMLGEGTSNVGFATTGTSGAILIDQGAGVDPAFKAMSGDMNILATGATAIQANVISTTSVEASKPAAGTTGKLFLPSDGFYLERDTGSTWAPWGPLFPFTPPVQGNFSWVNQGSATEVTANGGIYLSTTGAGSGTTANLRVMSAPVTPYTITAAFLPNMLNKQFSTCGLCFRNSTAGTLQLFILGCGLLQANANNYGTSLTSQKLTSPTVFSANYLVLSYNAPGTVWFRIQDNGTNRICSFSSDGQNFTVFHSIGRTDFLTADQIGYFVGGENTVTPNYGVGMTLLSWKQT